jgi:hypothetical protein
MTRRRRVFLLIIFGPLVAIGGLLIHLLRPPAEDTRPHPFNQDRNAIWLEHRWFEKPTPPEETEAFLFTLARHGVLYVYPHLIPFDIRGQLPTHDREQMRTFLASARRVAPRMRVLPWIGGLRIGYTRTLKGTVDLGNLSQRQMIVAECRGLMDEGFDGIHLNIEPIADGDDDFLALLRALRPTLGKHGLLSVSAIRPAPASLPFAPNFLWSTSYFGRVASHADQVVVMAYDTGLPTASLYRRYLSYASAAAVRATRRSSRSRVLIGVPTYDARGIMHRKGVETLRNALLGVISGMRELDVGGTFEGVALYASWTTDSGEWDTYNRLWRGLSLPVDN